MFCCQTRRQLLVLVLAVHGSTAFFLSSYANESGLLPHVETGVADVPTTIHKASFYDAGPTNQEEMVACPQGSSFGLVFAAGAAAGVLGTIALQIMLRHCHFQKLIMFSGDDSHDVTAAIQADTGDSKLQPANPFNLELFWPRCLCLCFLLTIQSGSSLILAGFDGIVAKYSSLVYFFTMLVGLGGNAGVQSAVLSVRRFANDKDVSIWDQTSVGIRLAFILAPLAFLRCFVQNAELSICAVVGIAAALVTVLATFLGTSLAVFLRKTEFDPAHASPAVQVLMDMIGLTIVCVVATAFEAMGWLIPSGSTDNSANVLPLLATSRWQAPHP